MREVALSISNVFRILVVGSVASVARNQEIAPLVFQMSIDISSRRILIPFWLDMFNREVTFLVVRSLTIRATTTKVVAQYRLRIMLIDKGRWNSESCAIKRCDRAGSPFFQWSHSPLLSARKSET